MMVKRRSHFLQPCQIAIIHRQHRISVQALGLAQALHGFKCRRARGRQCGNPSENVGGSIWRLLLEGDQRVPKQRQRAGERFGQDGSKFLLVSRLVQKVLPQLQQESAQLVLHLNAMQVPRRQRKEARADAARWSTTSPPRRRAPTPLLAASAKYTERLGPNARREN